MASNISTTNIDETFPVAGRDNDSQGFRDNFFYIKENLDTAYTEISDLQSGVARKDTDNDFDGNEIQKAVLTQSTKKLNTTYATGAATNIDIPWTSGYVHIIRATNDIQVTFTAWPNTEYAEMKLIITGDGSDRLVTIEGEGSADIFTDGNAVWTQNIITANSSTNPIVIDAFSYDNGNNVYLKYAGTFTQVP